MQKFARAVVGTNNVDCCARVCHAPSAAGAQADARRRPGHQLVRRHRDRAHHPGVRRQRHREITRSSARASNRPPAAAHASSSSTRDASSSPTYADVHLAIRPGTNIPLLNAMAHTIVARACTTARSWQHGSTALTPSSGSSRIGLPNERPAICGVDADAIRQAARLYATGPPAMSVHGLGLTEHVAGHRRRHRPDQPGAPDRQSRQAGVRRQSRCAARTTCRARRTWAAIRRRSRARRRSTRGRDAFERRWGVPIPATPRTAPAGDDGRGHRGAAEGALGRRIRRAPTNPNRRRHHPRAAARSTSSSCRTCS